jgi:hypothetical protein
MEYGSTTAADRTVLDKQPTSNVGPVSTVNLVKDVAGLVAASVAVTHRNPDRSAHIAPHAEERASHADECALAATAASTCEVALGLSAKAQVVESTIRRYVELLIRRERR